MAKETTKYSEVGKCPEKQCSSQSEMAQQTCNCPVLVGNLKYSNQDMEKETSKMKGYKKNVFREAYCQGVVELLGKNISKYCVTGKMEKLLNKLSTKFVYPSSCNFIYFVLGHV